MILASFLKAVGQIGDPRFRRVLMLGIGLTIALLVAIYAVFLTLIVEMVGDSTVLPVIGEVTWLGDLLGWSSLFFMLFLSVFLMVPVASAITSFFLDEVASAVEAKHYAHLPPVEPVRFFDALKDTVNFLGLLITANLVALVLAFAPRAFRDDLAGRMPDGRAFDRPAGEPCDSDPRSRDVYPSVPSTAAPPPIRLNISISSIEMMPDRIVPAIITHRTKLMPVVIHAFFLRW